MEKNFLLVCFLLLVLSSPVYSNSIPSTVSLPEKPHFEAIYQFGDSISDTGNIFYENPHDSCSQPPYGQDFFHHPTGRCSNGRLIIDFIAEAWGLPFLEPYLKKQGNFTHGANFAVAGSTANKISTLAEENIYSWFSNSSLFVQLGWFKSHLKQQFSSLSDVKKRLGKSLFIVESGGNDYIYASYDGSRSLEDLHAFVPQVIQAIVTVVKELIDVGAKQIILTGNFPVGCLPIFLATHRAHDPSMYDELGCLRNWNGFAIFHNDKLQNAIEHLRMEHPDVSIYYGDYYNSLLSIFKNASALGFDEDKIHQACCGSGGGKYNIGFLKWCGTDGTSVCLDSDKAVSWDGVHMTQHTYQYMANWLLNHIFPAAIQVA